MRLLPVYKFWIAALAGAGLLGGCAKKNYGMDDARLPAEAAYPLPPGTDSVHQAAAGRHYNQHGKVFAAIFGRHYRRTWAAPVAAPVLDLAHAAPNGGPLRPGKAGGGYQSISLTLTGPGGRSFALRTLDKDPRKTLPLWARSTFALNAVRDATSAANPYAALVVPPLTDALGLTAPHPRLVYVRPDETGLKAVSASFQGHLALLEEKFSSPADLPPALRRAGATDLLNSEDMLQNFYADPHYAIDQLTFLRARLLDVWLGDWDRHEKQWNWATLPQPHGRTRYLPLPKDRDQVFFRFDDGALPWFASRPFIAPQFQTFKPQYGNIRGLIQQATFIDQRSLSQRTRADFERVARTMQARLPDSLIERAVRRFPPAVFALEGPRTIAALRARRDALPQAADQFYLALARQPVVSGTTRPERFEVRRYADSVVVRVFAPVLGADSLRYRRTFLPAETRRIRFDGLSGNDVFDIQTPGQVPRIRLVFLYGPGPNVVHRTGSARRLRFFAEGRGQRQRAALRPRFVPPPKHSNDE